MSRSRQLTTDDLRTYDLSSFSASHYSPCALCEKQCLARQSTLVSRRGRGGRRETQSFTGGRGRNLPFGTKSITNLGPSLPVRSIEARSYADFDLFTANLAS